MSGNYVMSDGETVPLKDVETLTRLLLSIDDQACPFGCTYCFAQFGQYIPPATLAEVEADPGQYSQIDIIYPACDSDLFARNDFEDILQRVGEFKKSVSISTKAQVGRRAIATLRSLQNSLRPHGAVVKIGISISTKHAASVIEPHTPGYEARLRSLSRLRDEGIPSALVLKPMLSDVPDTEYREILSDCVGLTNRVLVGDEWLDQGEKYRRPRIFEKKSSVSQATVNWLPSHPQWSQRSMPGRISNLRKVAEELELKLFESDLHLMHDVLTENAVMSRNVD